MRRNKSLKKFYDSVYKSGERTHYTPKLKLNAKDLPNEDQEVIGSLKSWKKKEVLDVGCGTGRAAWEIAKLGAKRVVGIDFSHDAIAEAKKRPYQNNLEYRVETIAMHRGAYDVVIAIGTLEHMDDPYSTLKKLKRILKPKGVLIVTCPNWTNPRGYILQTLAQLFDAPITLADLRYLTPIEFEKWAKRLDMRLSWRTFDFDWAHGARLIHDFERRLPNVFRDMGLTNKQKEIDGFIKWIKGHVLVLDHTALFSGATGIYVMKRKE